MKLDNSRKLGRNLSPDYYDAIVIVAMQSKHFKPLSWGERLLWWFGRKLIAFSVA